MFLEHLGKSLPGRILLTMKLTTLFVFILTMQVAAGGFAQQKISLRETDASIKSLLKQIERQTEYRFVYSNNSLPAEKKLSVAIEDALLDEAMKTVLRETGLTYALKENNLVVIHSSKEEYREKIVRGRVTDEQGQPMPGVSVKVPGTTIGTVTDVNGQYNLSVPDQTGSLEFSFLGFTTQTLSISGRTALDVSLRADMRAIEEVTITGYTSYSREKSTSAASVVSGDKVAQVPNASLDQILQGRVPGMNVIASSGQPGQSASVTIRGLGTINGSSAPLFVMDGVPIESNYFQTINPNDVETVTVLKDASAKALYGSRGSNGVIVITTKKGAAGRVKLDYNSQYGFSDLTQP